MVPHGYLNNWNTGTRIPLFHSAYSNTPHILTSQLADVTGDGVLDTVFLTGTSNGESPYIRNIALVVIDGRTQKLWMYSLPENAGYDPVLWIGQITGEHKNDILITIQSGGSGGVVFAYVFSYINGKVMKIFDSVQYSKVQKYSVNYTDDHKVLITSKNPNKRYILDIQTKGKDYLNEIYTADGILKTPISGWVDPVGGIYPIGYTGRGIYALLIMQQVAGRYHADSLGIIENLLDWSGMEFKNVRQTVSIYGEDL